MTVHLWKSGLAVACLMVMTGPPAFAQIENEATAQGRYGGDDVISDPATQAVPVAEPSPRLTVRIEPPVTGDTDASGSVTAGDTLTYRIEVTNDGNILLENVSPGELRPVFDTREGDAVISDFELETETDTLRPGQSATYSGVYTLQWPDIYQAAGKPDAVSAQVTALGLRSDTGAIYISEDSARVASAIPAEPSLSLTKGFEFSEDSGAPEKADPGDVITYRYIVTNTGNVTLTDIRISDRHEGILLADGLIVEQESPLLTPGPLGVSNDATAGDSVWDTLGPGASVEFRYRHTVTEAEFAAQ